MMLKFLLEESNSREKVKEKTKKKQKEDKENARTEKIEKEEKKKREKVKEVEANIATTQKKFLRELSSKNKVGPSKPKA